jgi:outer membrane protein assembly factor BamB
MARRHTIPRRQGLAYGIDTLVVPNSACHSLTMRIARLGALVLAGAVAPPATFAWTVSLEAPPAAMVTDSLGNVLAAVPRPGSRNRTVSDIVKLDSRSGGLRWRHPIRVADRGQDTFVKVLAPIGDADVVVAGWVDSTEESGVLVARLAGRDGSESWRRVLRGSASLPRVEEATAVAVDLDGDVIVGGSLRNTPGLGLLGELSVAKLDGGDGTEQWRFSLPATLRVDVLAVDARGDVVAAGFVSGAPLYPTAIRPAGVTVVKLGGETGALLWRRDLDVAWNTKSIAVDAAGDVYIAVRTSQPTGTDFAVAKLAGSTGALIWLARESASDDTWEEALRVVVDASGAVYAAGATSDVPFSDGHSFILVFTIVRLDAATGDRIWSYRARGKPGGAVASSLLLAPSGRLIAAGYTTRATTCRDGLAIAMDAATGTPAWSRRVDGTLTSQLCHPGCEMGFCPVVDRDEITALAVDPIGRVIVAGSWVNRGEPSPRGSGFVRQLNVRR